MLNQKNRTQILSWESSSYRTEIIKRSILLIAFLLASVVAMNAQKKTVEETILEKDSIFWTAYNECDIPLMNNFLADDIEFYHDKSGIENGSKNLNEGLKNGLCKTGKNHLRREAVPGTVSVFQLKDKNEVYGAIITGEHLFYIVNDKTGKADGKAKFSHLWLLKEGQWKMHRVFSYDHGPIPYNNPKENVSLDMAQLKKFAGRYIMPSKDVIMVKVVEEKLELEAMGKTFIIYPESDNDFFTKERDLTFSFSKELPRTLSIFEGTNKVAEATLTE